eukprot:768320-Hanusia_phi.AAC.1
MVVTTVTFTLQSPGRTRARRAYYTRPGPESPGSTVLGSDRTVVPRARYGTSVPPGRLGPAAGAVPAARPAHWPGPPAAGPF